MVWGHQILLDVYDLNCNGEFLNHTGYLRLFIKDLLKAVGMKAWGRPKIMRLTNCADELSGTSIVQLLHTSSLVVHICDKTRTMYLDLFSCSDFHAAQVGAVIFKYFGGTVSGCRVVDRDATPKNL